MLVSCFFHSRLSRLSIARAWHSNCGFRSRSFISRQRTSSPEEAIDARKRKARFPHRYIYSARDWNIARRWCLLRAGEVTWIKENSIALTDEHGTEGRRSLSLSLSLVEKRTVKWRMAVTRGAVTYSREILSRLDYRITDVSDIDLRCESWR